MIQVFDFTESGHVCVGLSILAHSRKICNKNYKLDIPMFSKQKVLIGKKLVVSFNFRRDQKFPTTDL